MAPRPMKPRRNFIGRNGVLELWSGGAVER